MKSLIAGLTVAGVTVAGTAASLALALPGQAATTMTFTAKSLYTNGQELVDTNHNGHPDAGEEVLVAETLYNSSGKAVGYTRGTCTVVRVYFGPQGPGGEADCDVTAAVPGGQLILQGIDKSEGHDLNVAVTGGTGSFTGASGSAHVQSVGGSEDQTITITLS